MASYADSSPKKPLSYGTWPSEINAQSVSSGAPRIADCRLHPTGTYWLQSVAEEGGRTTLMCARDGKVKSLLDAPFNVRSQVHEYGGGAYCLSTDAVYFVNAKDQRIYKKHLDKADAPRALTHQESPSLRFADLQWDTHHGRIIAVAEDHKANAVENTLLAINPDGTLQTLHSGHDFYLSPRVSPNGCRLCFVSWEQPNMPWDETQLSVATLDDQGLIATIEQVQTSPGARESIVQPLWLDDTKLLFISDVSNWWNLYQYELGSDTSIKTVYSAEAEFATPAWVFGMQNYCVLDASTLLVSYTKNSRWFLEQIDLDTKKPKTVVQDASAIESVFAFGEQACFIQSKQDKPARPMIYRKAIGGLYEAGLSGDSEEDVDKGSISRAQTFCFPSNEPGLDVHAFYYSPTNSKFCGEPHTKPPAIFIGHGGPTGQSNDALDFKIQYWTSRGFAVIDVNYRGSTGYGRNYRHSLYKAWGVKDVEDMVSAANFFVNQGLVDSKQLIIKGGSAGGYTVLATLAFKDSFNAGVSLYGIGDLELLASDTHKFEAKYLDKLVGPYPEAKKTYEARSPIQHSEKLDCPILLFQGLEDKVVPPNQARTMRQALLKKKIPVALVEFEGEGHGFRKAENIEFMLSAEQYFYQRIFKLGDSKSAPIKIDNEDEIEHI